MKRGGIILGMAYSIKLDHLSPFLEGEKWLDRLYRDGLIATKREREKMVGQRVWVTSCFPCPQTIRPKFVDFYHMFHLHTTRADVYYHYVLIRYCSQKNLRNMILGGSALVICHCRRVLLDAVQIHLLALRSSFIQLIRMQ